MLICYNKKLSFAQLRDSLRELEKTEQFPIT